MQRNSAKLLSTKPRQNKTFEHQDIFNVKNSPQQEENINNNNKPQKPAT